MGDMRTAQDQQVLITRIFDAPRDLVFQAWADPDHVAQWFGPEGFDTPRDSVTIDLRVGGRYELGMVQKQSGALFPVRYEIIELDPPRLLVLRSDPMPETGMHEPTFTRIELHDHGDKTRMSTERRAIHAVRARRGRLERGVRQARRAARLTRFPTLGRLYLTRSTGTLRMRRAHRVCGVGVIACGADCRPRCRLSRRSARRSAGAREPRR